MMGEKVPQSGPEETALKGGVLALGNFDGVHRGHQALIKTAQDIAARHEWPLRVLTFEPHPRSVFAPDDPPFRLTSARDKERFLRAQGVHGVETIPFTAAFARVSAQEFVDRYLLEAYGAQHLVAGFDFAFGHRRSGDVRLLRAILAAHKVEVTELAPLRDAQGEIISSSRVRKLLQTGDVRGVIPLLNRPWSLSGKIVQGAQRGRTLDFPTANVELGEIVRPHFGVYAILARRLDDNTFLPGVANIGVRPTVEEGHEIMEFHLFNIHANLYGQEWEVELHHFLRPERAFPNLSALREQIVADVLHARALLACPPGPSLEL